MTFHLLPKAGSGTHVIGQHEKRGELLGLAPPGRTVEVHREGAFGPPLCHAVGLWEAAHFLLCLWLVGRLNSGVM